MFVGELVFVGIGYVGGGCFPNVVLCLQAGELRALFRMFGSNGGGRDDVGDVVKG